MGSISTDVQALPSGGNDFSEGTPREFQLFDVEGFVLDEQAAAEFHVLHGVRPMKMPTAMQRLLAAEKKIGKGKYKDTGRAKARMRERSTSDVTQTVDAGVASGYESQDGTDLQDESMTSALYIRGTTGPSDKIEVLTGPSLPDNDDDESDDDWHARDEVDSNASAHFFEQRSMDEDDAFGVPSARWWRNAEGTSSNLWLGSQHGPSGDAQLRIKAKAIVCDAGRYGWENNFGLFKPFRRRGADHCVAVQPMTGIQEVIDIFSEGLEGEEEEDGQRGAGSAEQGTAQGADIQNPEADGSGERRVKSSAKGTTPAMDQDRSGAVASTGSHGSIEGRTLADDDDEDFESEPAHSSIIRPLPRQRQDRNQL